MLRTLIIQVCYGGKIDHEGDASSLTTLVNRVMVPESFEDDFDIVKAVSMGVEESASHHRLVLPTATSWEEFERWVSGLPEREPPSYLGLPENAEKLLLMEHGKEMIRNVKLVMKILDESEQSMAEADASEGKTV